MVTTPPLSVAGTKNAATSEASSPKEGTAKVNARRQVLTGFEDMTMESYPARPRQRYDKICAEYVPGSQSAISRQDPEGWEYSWTTGGIGGKAGDCALKRVQLWELRSAFGTPALQRL